MNLMVILSHLSAYASALTQVEAIIQGCIKQKRAPNAADDAALIAVAENLISSGAISIPSMDAATVTASLEEIKALIASAAPAAPAA